MKIQDVYAFYSEDNGMDILENRPGFLAWFKENYPADNIETMQIVVDTFVSWYTIKFPSNKFSSDRELDNELINKMTFDRLLYRLSVYIENLLLCRYRDLKGGYSYNYNYKVDIGGKVIQYNTLGEILYSTIKELGLESDLTLEDFRNKYKDKYDMTKIDRIIKMHENDLILRNHLLDAARRGILYSNTTPDNAKYRASMFLEDIQLFCGNIDYDQIGFDPQKYCSEETTRKSIFEKIFRR